MNRSTFKLMPYINKAKTRADGTTSVLLRITIDGKKTVMTTDFICRPELWDAKQGEIISPTKDANALREFIKKAGLSHLVFLAVDKEILRSNPLENIEYEKVKRNVGIRYLTREQVKMFLPIRSNSDRWNWHGTCSCLRYSRDWHTLT